MEAVALHGFSELAKVLVVFDNDGWGLFLDNLLTISGMSSKELSLEEDDDDEDDDEEDLAEEAEVFSMSITILSSSMGLSLASSIVSEEAELPFVIGGCSSSSMVLLPSFIISLGFLASAAPRACNSVICSLSASYLILC
jgi:putative Mn2+ efflux pump MntP